MKFFLNLFNKVLFVEILRVFLRPEISSMVIISANFKFEAGIHFQMSIRSRTFKDCALMLDFNQFYYKIFPYFTVESTTSDEAATLDLFSNFKASQRITLILHSLPLIQLFSWQLSAKVRFDLPLQLPTP